MKPRFKLPSEKIVALLLFALVLAGFSAEYRLIPRAAAQATPTPAHTIYEYGFLTLNDGDSTFSLGYSQIIIRPPTSHGTGGESPNGQFPSKPNLVTKDVWDNQAIAMDALGAQGWEAVTVLNDGRKTSILMRRQI